MELIARVRSYSFPIGLLIRLGVIALALAGQGLSAGAMAFALLVLAADLSTYLLLRRLGPAERQDEVARLYWLSPLVIWLLHGVGSLAAISAAALVASFLAMERRRYGAMGLLTGLACVIQPALILLLLPLLALFASSLSRLRQGSAVLMIVAAGVAAFGLLLSFSGVFGLYPNAASMMVADFTNLFTTRLTQLGGAGIAVLPLLLAGIAYIAWRARLIDRELLWTFFTLALLAATAVAAPAAGTALLAVLFLSKHAAYAERSGLAGLAVLSALLLLQSVLVFPSPVFALFTGGAELPPHALAEPLRLALPSAIAAVAALVAAQVVQRGIARSHSFLATRRPVAIGIAGDSGVGKDALADAVSALFSPRTVASVSGDDYHNWDRNKPMWRTLTHLNPRANDLPLFRTHVTQLIDRRWVRARHYDHVSGRMTKPLLTRPGELVVASGLHALAAPSLNTLYDLRVFLDMDEDLRRFFKVRRDVTVRGHPLQRVLASIERRRPDAIAYIHPQKDAAHIVFRLMPTHPDRLDPMAGKPVPMKLLVDAVPGVSFADVTRGLVGIAGIQAAELPLASNRSRLVVEGDPSPADIAAVARRIIFLAHDLMRDEPAWEGGLMGVMQLIMLHQIEQVWHRRSVNA